MPDYPEYIIRDLHQTRQDILAGNQIQNTAKEFIIDNQECRTQKQMFHTVLGWDQTLQINICGAEYISLLNILFRTRNVLINKQAYKLGNK